MRLGQPGSEYLLVNAPSGVDITFDELMRNVPVLDGVDRYYHYGYRARVFLDFSGAWIDATQYENFRAIFNYSNSSSTAALRLYPNEISYPSYALDVRWKGGFNFAQVPGANTGIYTGSIELEGTESLTTIPQAV